MLSLQAVKNEITPPVIQSIVEDGAIESVHAGIGGGRGGEFGSCTVKVLGEVWGVWRWKVMEGMWAAAAGCTQPHEPVVESIQPRTSWWKHHMKYGGGYLDVLFAVSFACWKCIAGLFIPVCFTPSESSLHKLWKNLFMCLHLLSFPFSVAP